MADLTLFETLDGGDVEIVGNNVPLTDAIFNQIYLGLFGGNVAQSTQNVSPDQDERFDFFANDLLFADSPEKQFNSSFENLLSNVSLNSAGLRALETAALKDLSFMKDLAEISVDISLDGNDRIQIDILAQEPDSTQEQSFTIIWDATRNEQIQGDDTSEEVSPAPVDPDAQAWIDRLTSPSQTVQDAINDLIIAEKAANNFVKWDYFLCTALGAVNGLIEAKSITATGFGGLAFGANGAVFNGINGYINTNFSPSIDGVNYGLDDMAVHVFVYSKAAPISGLDTLMGTFTFPRVTLMDVSSIDQVRSYSNGSTASIDTNALSSDTLVSLVRESATEIKTYRNGVLSETLANNSQQLTNSDLFFGALNNSGSPLNYYTGILPIISITKGGGFDVLAHNTNIRAFLTAIGAL